MHELRGKGLRVLGYFIWMLGAGVVLDANAPWGGGLIMAVGGAIFACGVWQSLTGGTEAAP